MGNGNTLPYLDGTSGLERRKGGLKVTEFAETLKSSLTNKSGSFKQLIRGYIEGFPYDLLGFTAMITPVVTGLASLYLPMRYQNVVGLLSGLTGFVTMFLITPYSLRVMNRAMTKANEKNDKYIQK